MDPYENMAFDEALMLMAPEIGAPTLRFYGWQTPAATFGYFQHYNDVEQWTQLRPLIRRPTGGGLVPHDADWTYSLVFPVGHEWYELKAVESYERLHLWLRNAFMICRLQTNLAPIAIPEGSGQCFIGAEQHDLLADGRKIAGAAQRRTRTALLIQGSVQPIPTQILREDWEQAMLDAGAFAFGNSWETLKPSEVLLKTASELRSKYASEAFTRKR